MQEPACSMDLLVFSRNGKFLASGARNGRDLVVWDLSVGRKLHHFGIQARFGILMAIEFSFGDEYIVAGVEAVANEGDTRGGEINVIEAWNVVSGTGVATPNDLTKAMFRNESMSDLLPISGRQEWALAETVFKQGTPETFLAAYPALFDILVSNAAARRWAGAKDDGLHILQLECDTFESPKPQ
jgi:hypothetical protein